MYEEALRFCGDNPFVLQAYGVFQQKQGDLRRAMDLFDAAIKHGPKHSAAWLAKAQLLWELGRKREARECFQTAVSSNPTNEVLWHAWGVAEKRDGNFGVARKLLRKATEINPRNSFCWHAWAVMEQELANADLAVQLYQNALKAFPNSSHTYQAWALLEKERGHWDVAFKVRPSVRRLLFPNEVCLSHAWPLVLDSTDATLHPSNPFPSPQSAFPPRHREAAVGRRRLPTLRSGA